MCIGISFSQYFFPTIRKTEWWFLAELKKAKEDFGGKMYSVLTFPYTLGDGVGDMMNDWFPLKSVHEEGAGRSLEIQTPRNIRTLAKRAAADG
jgi:hypothetical protein